MNKITGEQIIQAVRDLAAERPDAVYRANGSGTCFYTRNGRSGEMGCIVGQALIRVDPAVRSILEWLDDQSDIPCAFALFDNLYIKGRYSITPAQREWLYMAQAEQDRASPWSGAVEYADEAHETVDGHTPCAGTHENPSGPESE